MIRLLFLSRSGYVAVMTEIIAILVRHVICLRPFSSHIQIGEFILALFKKCCSREAHRRMIKRMKFSKGIEVASFEEIVAAYNTANALYVFGRGSRSECSRNSIRDLSGVLS